MWKDEIVEEIHRIREEHAKTFNYDLDAIFADWQKRQNESGRKIISAPLKKANQTLLSNKTKAVN
jgi:vacuolar-type H+-ATPase subunit E/Vma4